MNLQWLLLLVFGSQINQSQGLCTMAWQLVYPYQNCLLLQETMNNKNEHLLISPQLCHSNGKSLTIQGFFSSSQRSLDL